MVTDVTPPQPATLVVVVGPQASGKSTLATALGVELRRRGETVAVVELDQVAAMASPTLPGWDAAHEVFEVAVGAWARSGLSCVVAEGSGSADEVTRLRGRVPSGAPVLVVATTTDVATAFERARADPARGVSRDRDFLDAVYGGWPDELVRIDPDLVVDTGVLGAEAATTVVLSRLEQVGPGRGGQASSTRSA